MSIKEILNEIIKELGNIGDTGFDFMTARNGFQCGFTREANRLFYLLSDVIHKNDSQFKTIELENFVKIVKQCTIDFYTENEFKNYTENDILIIQKLKEYIKAITIKQMTMFTHYIPAMTLGMEKVEIFKLGTVEIMSLENWIDSINIIGRECFNNYDWKKYLKAKLKNETIEAPPEPCDWMLDSIYNAIKNAQSIIKISINNFERDYSYKLAKIIAKTTLDSISLLLNKDAFYQQVLISERIAPVMTYRIVESNGNLWLPGNSLGKRVPIISARQAHEELVKDDNKKIIEAMSKILCALEDPRNSEYPKLSSRWATALDWYAEGIREENDAIALTKIATSLDVLSSGGKNPGILEMLNKIFNISDNTVVLKDISKDITLKEFVKEIYDYGRSKILHGTHHERLQSFEKQREQASIITKIALLECLLLLNSYSGKDLDVGFGKLLH